MFNSSARSIQGEEIIMFYNVENFFRPDEILPQNSAPSISGLKNWDERKFRNKLRKTAHVFQLIKEKNGSLPMLIGLSEVQGNYVLQEIINLPVFENQFRIVHFESMDERGVDVALIYDKRKIEILNSESISYFFEIVDENLENYDATRDVLYCRAKYEEDIINIYVCHLPSKRENDINKPKRSYILKNIRERVEQNLSVQHEAVLVMGDFNENPDEENLQNLLQNKYARVQLTNPFAALFAEQCYSTFHYRFGLLFDQILLSNHFFTGQGTLHFENADIFNDERICSRDKRFKGRPFRTYAGSQYLGGYSDHFPVYVKLNKSNNKIK